MHTRGCSSEPGPQSGGGRAQEFVSRVNLLTGSQKLWGRMCGFLPGASQGAVLSRPSRARSGGRDTGYRLFPAAGLNSHSKKPREEQDWLFESHGCVSLSDYIELINSSGCRFGLWVRPPSGIIFSENNGGVRCYQTLSTVGPVSEKGGKCAGAPRYSLDNFPTALRKRACGTRAVRLTTNATRDTCACSHAVKHVSNTSLPCRSQLLRRDGRHPGREGGEDGRVHHLPLHLRGGHVAHREAGHLHAA